MTRPAGVQASLSVAKTEGSEEQFCIMVFILFITEVLPLPGLMHVYTEKVDDKLHPPGCVSLRRFDSRALRFSVAFSIAAKWDVLAEAF